MFHGGLLARRADVSPCPCAKDQNRSTEGRAAIYRIWKRSGESHRPTELCSISLEPFSIHHKVINYS